MSHEEGIKAATMAVIASVPRGYGMTQPEALQYSVVAIRAYLQASGMVLVPSEPTQGMLHSMCQPEDWSLTEIYQSVISAFPSPFKDK